MKILIADDDAVSRRLMETTIEHLGHDYVSVTDGSEALTALLDPDGPRLAILDWMMPGLDGLAVCRAIRERAAPYVYLILLTARNRHEDMITGLDAGADDFLAKPCDVVELRARLRSGERLVELQEHLLHVQEELRHEATHDRLTGLWNRGMILDQLGRDWRQTVREGRPIGLVIADLDRFKLINDTHGHAVGDEVLKHAAERFRTALRDYDRLGRYGGEEFLMVLPGCTLPLAAAVAERARLSLAKHPARIGSLTLDVTASFGVVSVDTGESDHLTLVEAADEALYRAKAAGRNQVSA